MQIYPSKHKIVSTQNVNLNIDMPLAYIDTKSTEYNINIVPLLQKNEKQEVIPYSYFDSLNTLFFDKNNNEIQGSNYLEREGTKYKFKPELIHGTSSFVPLNFSYNIIGKKNCIYKSDQQYNLRISCIDNVPDLQLSNKLIPLFGNAPDRGICPSNISVNNRDKTIQTLSSSAIQDNDFIFIESSNGLQYKNYWTPGVQYNPGETVYYNKIRYVCGAQHVSASSWTNDQGSAGVTYWTQVSDLYNSAVDKNINIVEEFLSKNVNLWICTEDYLPNEKIMSSNVVSISSPVAININNMEFPYSFNAAVPEVDTDIILHNLFDSYNIPVLIYEYVNKGFVIVTPREFMDNIDKYTDLFYEVLITIYLKSYTRSQSFSDWISDKMPNYIVTNGKLTQKERFTSRNEVYKIFGLNKGELDLIDVYIDSKYSYVKFDGFINDFIIFKKDTNGDNAKYADKSDWSGISVYIQGKIVLMKDFTYTVEESVADKILWNISNNKVHFTIKPFKSSVNNINASSAMLSYDLAYNALVVNSINLFLCYSGTFSLVAVDKYNLSDGIKIAEIQISKQDADNTIFDMRQRGGGLPEYVKPNYDLLDIGNINGRPYRKAGTLVITMPERLKPYEDLILKAVKKHMVAEDYPIILFE